jgi:hypothetical protein
MFSGLSNKTLVDSYIKALEHELDRGFICLLKEEIIRRGIKFEK